MRLSSLWLELLLLPQFFFVAVFIVKDVWAESSSSSSSSSSDKDKRTPSSSSTTAVCEGASCSATAEGYDALLDIPEVWHNVRAETCDDTGFFDVDWTILQVYRSMYQHVEFCQDPRDDDVCLELDNVVQICASYRPHYHELMVHYPARFLQSVKRVAFIGGGDSMLLHEVLKYPSLELVIGLELDPQVPRGTFKYFGVQPHWDDERVEWWFGDATKSLMVLPKEYYGSFDLVLVDLSETVMALSVTEGLDVMQALSLLLKPDGVFVQNEIMHFLEAAAVFQYSMHSHYFATAHDGIAWVCSQSVILASHGVNFLRPELTDHKVDYILDDLFDDDVDLPLLIRDFQHNASNTQGNCRRGMEEEVEVAVQKQNSAGVVMIVDAEGISSSKLISTSTLLVKTIEQVIEKEGFSVVASSSSASSNPLVDDDDDDEYVSVAFILQEGYLIVHCSPKLMYCGIDIHLWTNLDRQENLKKSILKAIGSTSASTFRIVAGRMLGTKTRKDDENTSRGPLSVDVCGVAPEIRRDQKVDSSKFNKVLEKSMGIVVDSDEEVVVAVMCGRKNESCGSIEVLEKTGRAHVLALWTCADLSDGVEYSQEAAARLQACEAEIVKSIRTFISEEEDPLDAIVVDSSAPFVIGQLILHIVEDELRRQGMFAEHRLVVSPMKQSWHRVFVDRFRTAVFKEEPLFRAEVLFNTTYNSFGMTYVSSGDPDFVESLVETVEQIEKDAGLVADIQNIRGPDVFPYEEEIDPHIFTHLDYDQSSPFQQWISQRQVFGQSFVQFEAKGERGSAVTPESIRSALEQVLSDAFDADSAKEVKWASESTSLGSGTVVVALWEGGSFVVFWDGNAHVDANCLSSDDDACVLSSDDEEDSLADSLIAGFKDKFNLETVLMDDHPRGIGRVVNWRKDVEGYFPIWASAFANASERASS